ncbi:permease, partial [Fulvivirga sp.]
SPLVNEVAIGLFVGLFGIKTTIIYVVSGVMLGTISGIILQKLRLENLLTPWVKEILANSQREQDKFKNEQLTLRQRLPIIWTEVTTILKGVMPYVIIGIAIGGLMHGYVPEGFFEQYMDKDNLFAVPIATIFAIPMYSNAAGILPVVQVLVAKGIPLGTAIAFMMGVVGLSLPEAMLLKKIMTFKLIATFFGVVTLCIIISGYLFNMLL